MTGSPTTPKPQWLRVILAAIGAIASAALVGALIASLLSIDSRAVRTKPQKPFDASSPIR